MLIANNGIKKNMQIKTTTTNYFYLRGFPEITKGQNIWRQTVPTVKLTFIIWPRSNLNMLIESILAISYLMSVVMLALSGTILENVSR